ncbi:MAG: peptide chain release factor N(5)-glutamine methyltransferase [Oscillospiraceae bacterium]|nr:peptide chain release factor N(5)-glutamine methyltransferase [Oscillospiraceae bacterium]
MAITYNNLYLDIRREFRLAGIEAASLEAREIVCHAAGKTREQFLVDMNYYIPTELERRTRELARRRLEGEPAAYLLGEWSFWGLDLDVDRNVLIPRSDTEVVAEQAVRRAKEAGDRARVLDLCAGTGCIGLSVATYAPNCRVVLADYSSDAVRICRQNIRRTGRLSNTTCFQVDARETPPQQLWEFDVIVSNPPYIPSGDLATLDHSVRDYEPHLALDGGEDGLDFYRVITQKWKTILRDRGWLIYEVGIGQAEEVENILLREGFWHVKSYPDTAGILRVVEGQWLLPEEPDLEHGI